MNVRLVRFCGYFGVGAPVLGLTMVLLAISTAPWFSWTANALSDLGVYGFTALIFNSSIQMTAIIMSFFSLGIYELTKGNRIGTLGFVLNLAGAGFLLGIAAFPETAGPIHYQFSVAFFVTLPISLLVLSLNMKRIGMGRLSLFTAAAGATALLVWTPRWEAVAIPEFLSALAVGLWSIVLGARMTRMRARNGEGNA
ncbi:MAG: DUF998 domain-containing protein [Candidatus Bathyarchaeia archaeon]